MLARKTQSQDQAFITKNKSPCDYLGNGRYAQQRERSKTKNKPTPSLSFSKDTGKPLTPLLFYSYFLTLEISVLKGLIDFNKLLSLQLLPQLFPWL